MLFAPTAAKHDLTAPATVGGLKKSNCVDAVVAKKNHPATALLTNGLRHFNHQQSHQQRQHHDNEQQQQQQQQEQRPQQSQDDLKVKQQPRDFRRPGLHQYHVQNSAINDHQHHQQQQQQQLLTMDAMKKLDAKLVAYLAGEKLIANQVGLKIEEQEVERVREELCSSSRPLNDVVISPNGLEQLDLFKRISGIKLQMEALTLQPEGTKRMELLQNDIRPIFTVECQLSHHLIKNVPRYDMFHVMQFESEKFQSLTQCTRFGQEDQRSVKLDLTGDSNKNSNNNNSNNKLNNETGKLNLGHIHFTVWWREPGTCFNEMLGMGVLALEELYTASILEQCKNIIVQRRNVHLANLYFKISLQIGPVSEDEISSTAETEAETDATPATSDAADAINNKLNASGEYADQKCVQDTIFQ